MAFRYSVLAEKPSLGIERRITLMKAKSGKHDVETAICICLMACLAASGCVNGSGSKAKTLSSEANATFATDPFEAKPAPEPTVLSLPSWEVVFETTWSQEIVGQEPADLFVLDGNFVIAEKDGDKALALLGTPVGDFGFLFGPRVRGKPVELTCRVFSTRKGRRMPAFAAGLGGVNGYRLRVNAAARNTQLVRGEETLASIPYVWKSGTWTRLRFRAEPKGEEGVTVSAKVWPVDENEPADWTLKYESPEPYVGGKSTLWGYPYAGTEILFDDLRVLAFGN